MNLLCVVEIKLSCKENIHYNIFTVTFLSIKIANVNIITSHIYNKQDVFFRLCHQSSSVTAHFI